MIKSIRLTNHFALVSAIIILNSQLAQVGNAQDIAISSKSRLAKSAGGPKLNARLPAQSKAASAMEDNPVRNLIERFTIDNSNLYRFYTIDFAADRLDRFDQLVQNAQSQLQQIDFKALTQNARVDYLLLQNYLDHEKRQFGHQRTRNTETIQIVPFAPTIITLEENRWKVEPLDPQKVAKQLTDLAQAIKNVHTQVITANTGAAKTQTAPQSQNMNFKISPVVANRAAGVVQEMRQILNVWFTQYDSFRPDFAWWCRKPYEAAVKELDSYASDLREKVAGVRPGDDSVLLGDPIGRSALLDDLKSEMIAYSPEELIQIADKEMAWCETQMKLAAKQMGQEDWKAALAIVKGQYAPPGEQDQFVAEQARKAIAFVDERNLVTIDPLCRETWRLQMMSAGEQKFLPFAAYGGQKVMVAYATDQMDYDAKMMSMRGNNKAFTHIVTPHELIPGHHLQGYMAARYRPYRELFRTPFLVEGWSLYWEMRLWDLNYARTPEEKIGMLFWRMHRCARIIVSLKFHLGQMTPPQMIDYLVDRVGHERDGATSEVRRFIGGGYSPLYQVAYMIGGKQLYALHKELVENGKMSEREFHDAVLKENMIPIEMIRAGLAHTPLTSDYSPAWHFADTK